MNQDVQMHIFFFVYSIYICTFAELNDYNGGEILENISEKHKQPLLWCRELERAENLTPLG